MPTRQITVLVVLLSLCATPLPSFAKPPKEAQPIYRVAEVSVGMKGYGMTVFHGTTIEPFNVEVVSINANETPNHSVIWVRCTDERMIKTGPVQGMSGSPIYLWAPGEEQVLGKGGRLIGAFAFGFGDTNECVVGVQPIEYMRAVGARATAKDRPELSLSTPKGAGLELMSRLSETAKKMDVPELTRARLDAMRDLYKAITPSGEEIIKSREKMLELPKGPADRQGLASRMMVPMAVGSSEIAQALGPALMPLGIQPFAVDPSAMGGKPPKGFDVDNVELVPGSALVVPFAWGDADLAGAGTVTDVLPDGTVLGFGHAMDGIGATAIPMATGYIHFIVSLRTISYKKSGTLNIKGALVQDEETAVAGTSARPFTTAPVHVDVNIEGQPKYSYDYEVLNHPQLTPMIAAAVVAQSAAAVQGPPAKHMVHYNTKATFSSGHSFEFESAAPGAGGQVAAMFTSMLVGTMLDNPFEKVTLKSVDTTIDIKYGFEFNELISAKLDKTTVEPGQTVNATLELMGLYQKPVKKTIQIKIPEDMPEGETQLMLADSATYTQMMFTMYPHLMQIDSLDKLAKAASEVFSADPSTLYVVVPTGRVGLALKGENLLGLPASKAALLSDNNPNAEIHPQFEVSQIQMEQLYTGSTPIQLTIKRSRGSR